MALADGVADEGVLGLQVEDVELVDARRHQQKRLFVHLVGERLVFDELEILVLEHHRAFGGGDVFADFEHALVGHRHVALLGVVQHVGQTLGQAFALRVDGFLLRLGVEGEEVAGRGGGHPLLDGEADAVLGLGVALGGLGHRHQRARVEQVHRGGKRGQWVLRPGIALEAAVLQARVGLQALIPQFGGIAHVVLLQFHQLLGRELDLRHVDGRHGLAGGVAQIHGLELLKGLQPGFGKALAHGVADHRLREVARHLLPQVAGLVHAVSFVVLADAVMA